MLKDVLVHPAKIMTVETAAMKRRSRDGRWKRLRSDMRSIRITTPPATTTPQMPAEQPLDIRLCSMPRELIILVPQQGAMYVRNAGPVLSSSDSPNGLAKFCLPQSRVRDIP